MKNKVIISKTASAGILFVVIGMMITALFRVIIPQINTDFLLWPVIAVSLICFIIYFYNSADNNYRIYILLAIILRFTLLLWNVYCRNIYTLPGVGTDTENFYTTASIVSDDLSLLGRTLYGGYYSRYLALVYFVTGPSYLFGSYLNFLYGLIIISKLLHLINDEHIILTEKEKLTAIILLSFEPTNMIICSSLRRESLIAMFLSCSVWEIYCWYYYGNSTRWINALVFSLLASSLHAGVIGVLTGYIVIILFYSKTKEHWDFNFKTIVLGIVFALVGAVLFFRYRGVFLNKLIVEDQEELFHRMERAVGGAAYLRSMRINSFSDFLLYIPLKLLYFLFAPMPWDWRGLSDVLAFTIDSTFYIFLIRSAISGMRKARTNPVAFAMCLSFFASAVIYAAGSSNSANAMRHRMKLLFMLVGVYVLVHSEKNRKVGHAERVMTLSL